ncbi:MAG: aldehyde ferredoxin oxidoreductase family protein [Candidatus Bathyarchaeia archaeon]
MKDFYGYSGKILRIDLTKRKTFVSTLSKDLISYIGGTGFCIKMIYDETGPETNPLGPENRIVFATGPLSGTPWPTSARLNIAAKSPLTNIWGESNSGGHFTAGLKLAGYDLLIIQGISQNPIYILIDDDKVEFKDASHIWGKNAWEADEVIKKDESDESLQTVCIGQAGENLVKFASILTDRYRTAARSGLGAVMGSKNLKAIAVGGSNNIKVFDSEKFWKILEKMWRKYDENPFTANIKKYGSMILVDGMNEIGRFPTKNHQTGVFPMAHKINADAVVNEYKIGSRACFGCYLGCESFLRITSGKFSNLLGDNPEYETLNSLGGRCWNDDLETILYMNWLCNQYGIDTISTGAVIAFMMELWEKGIITKEDTDGLDFSWGNKETMIEVIKKIAFREGIGNILAEGVKRASEIIGKGSEKYAMHVKGLEIPSQDGRAHKSMAIAHATSPRGADHLRHCTFYDEIGFPDAIVSRFGKQYLPEMADRLAIKYKGILAKGCEDAAAIMNALPLCVSGGTFWPPLIWWDEMAEIYSTTTGINLSSYDLKLIADRIVNLKRAYNIKHCLSKKDDILPERFLKEPLPEGPPKGHVVELEPMLTEYYKERGWDLKTGFIPRSKLEALGLKSVADELEKIGKIPP